jgi:putative SOS response-associated peptidase YedK
MRLKGNHQPHPGLIWRPARSTGFELTISGFQQPLGRAVASSGGAAGLWEPPQKILPEGATPTFTVITTTARDQAGQVHDRMPVFLPLGELDGWMRDTPEQALEMLSAWAVPPIAIYPVTRRVNKAGQDDPSFIEPIDLEAV